MKIEDIFGAIVRLGGLALVVFGLMGLAMAGLAAAGVPFPSRYGQFGDALAALVWLVFGLALALGADALTRLLYRKPPRPKSEHSGPWA